MPNYKNFCHIAKYMDIEAWELLRQLSGTESEQDISKEDIFDLISQWEDREKITLINKLFEDLLTTLSSEEKFVLVQKLTRPSSQPE